MTCKTTETNNGRGRGGEKTRAKHTYSPPNNVFINIYLTRVPLFVPVCVLLFSDGTPHLWQTDPTGTCSEWTANAIGRSTKTVSEYLEKHHTSPDTCSEASAIRLAVSSLLEVVESGGKNIEVAVIRRGKPMELVSQEELDTLSKEITEEKEKAKAASAERTENN